MCVCVCVCGCVYINIYVCVYIYIYIYIYKNYQYIFILIHIWLNIIDIFGLHILLLILYWYTYFKLHGLAAHKYNSTLEYRHNLVKRQITLSKDNINTLINAHSYKKKYIQKLHHFLIHLSLMGEGSVIY